MEHIENLTYYIANFVDELAANDVQKVVISPGSRSTPLAMAFSQHPDMNKWVVLDERSAAFFALGMAKANKQPVVLVCTSGTAAANYFPAIVEAHYSRTPLIVLTADRPHELRDIGAPQAIEQIKMYGDYVKWFHEMALPEGNAKLLDYVRNKAFRAAHLAMEGNAGVIHLNFPIREPHIPDFSLQSIWRNNRHIDYQAFDGERHISDEQINVIANQLAGKQNGLLVCGPQVNEKLAARITAMASQRKLPILADPLSGIRSGSHPKENIIEGYDAFFRSKSIRKSLKPEFIIRFGAMPVSKAYMFYIQEHGDVPQYVVEEAAGYREPVGNPTQFIYSDPTVFCEKLIKVTDDHDFTRTEMWLDRWQSVNKIAKEYLTAPDDQFPITEGDAVSFMLSAIPDRSVLYIGNSMAIRDLDTFFMTTSKHITVLSNRGANGIDGMISSAAGSGTNRERVTLLLGDLSFFHDMNGLLVIKQYQIDITIILVNNNGGGIFSFLPQADQKDHFEALFGTPLNMEFEHAAAMYGGAYDVCESKTKLTKALHKSYQTKGLSIIEVRTDRNTNKLWHQEKWQMIEQEIMNGVNSSVFLNK